MEDVMLHPESYYHDKLTIVVPLINREVFTVRYLHYLESVSFPFKILLADGGKDLILQQALEKREIAPSLNYTYVRFPYDETFLDFYSKNRKSMELVETPYAMFNCNDDIPVVSGLYECIDFLDQSREYVSASGKVGGFSIKEEKNANRFLFHESFYSGGNIESFEQETAVERVTYQFVHNKSFNIYYGVHRTPVIQKITQDIELLGFKDLLLYEMYFVTGLMAFGKTKFIEDCFTYFRQRDTSFATGFLKRWYANVFFNNWMIEVEYYIDSLSARVFENELGKMPFQEIKEMLQNALATGILQLDIAPVVQGHMWQKIRCPYTYYSKIKNVLRNMFLSSSFARKLENNYRQKKFLASTDFQKPEVEGIIKQLQL
jgi:glycosyltransferase domain-containing protein